MDMQKELAFPEASRREESKQPVKLRRYRITKANGDYFKDWLRFWNQCMVEIVGTKIADIIKFIYLLELVQRQPKNDILGLPHTIEGCAKAMKIFEENYGKDIKVHKALRMELEKFPEIIIIIHMKVMHGFYKSLSRVVKILKTMKKINKCS